MGNFVDRLHPEAAIALQLQASGCHESALPWLCHKMRELGYTSELQRSNIATAIDRMKSETPNFWPSDEERAKQSDYEAYKQRKELEEIFRKRMEGA